MPGTSMAGLSKASALPALERAHPVKATVLSHSRAPRAFLLCNSGSTSSTGRASSLRVPQALSVRNSFSSSHERDGGVRCNSAAGGATPLPEEKKKESFLEVFASLV